MPFRSVIVIAAKELGDAWRNRWFLLFSGAFAVVALALAWLSVTGVAGAGHASFGRTAASLINLVVLVVPLMGLTLGANSVAGERERGSLLHLLAQPLLPREILLGKFLGLAAAVVAALLLGFGVAGLVLAGRGAPGEAGPYLAFLGLAALLSAAAVAIGLLISTFSSKVSVAAGVALFGWLVLVFLGDLGLMGTSLALDLGARELLVASLANPLQVFKVASLLVLRGGLDVLGPAGALALRTWGDALAPGLVGILVLWTVAPLAMAAARLDRKGGL